MLNVKMSISVTESVTPKWYEPRKNSRGKSSSVCLYSMEVLTTNRFSAVLGGGEKRHLNSPVMHLQNFNRICLGVQSSPIVAGEFCVS